MRLLEITRASPLRLFVSLLAVMALAETVAMLVAPALLSVQRPSTSTIATNVALMTVLSAPVLWLLVLFPLKRRADEERRKSDVIIATAPDGVLVFDVQGTIRSFNASAARITGFTADETVGRPLESLMPPRGSDLLDRHLKHLLDTGRPLQLGTPFESTLRHRDGHCVPVELAVSRMTVDGRPHYVAIVRDIGARKRAEDSLRQAEAHFRALVEQSLIGIYLYQDGRFRYLNPKMAEILGHTVDELYGLDPLELVVPEDRARVRENIRARLEGEATDIHYDFRVRRKDGEVARIEVHGSRTVFEGRPAIISVAADVTQRYRAQMALQRSERRLSEIADVLAEGIYVLDADLRLSFMNPAAERMLGWRMEELMGKDPHAAFHYKDPSGVEVPLEACPVHLSTLSGETYRNHEDYFVRKDGSWLPVAIVSAPIIREGRVAGAVAAFHDISERLEAEQELREKEERYRLLFNSARDAIFVSRWGPGHWSERLVEVNDVACQRLGWTRAELLGMTPLDLVAEPALAAMQDVAAEIERSRHAMYETMQRTRTGESIPVEVNAHLFDLQGEPMMIAMVRDIADRKRAEARIQHLAHHDPLTDLANRRLLMDRLDQVLAQARRHNRRLAILFVDLDGFKPVNDTYGHDAGDELLKTVGRRLRTCVRQGDTVARMGGDEFVILLAEIQEAEDADAVADKIRVNVAEPLVVEGNRIEVTASVGISLWPGDGEDGEALIREADARMYRAKASGKNGSSRG